VLLFFTHAIFKQTGRRTRTRRAQSLNAAIRVSKNRASRREPALCGFYKCSHGNGWKLEAGSWKLGWLGL